MHIEIPASQSHYTSNPSSHEKITFSISNDFSVRIKQCTIENKESLAGKRLSFSGVGDTITLQGITFEMKS